ncbi:carbohydrate ABC transporter permease [Herbiconiux sp. YIM B11900]|uniref:carbohydrate ABC transporter permease n=1 Tax=Herbiconiux sp. YIM B11900 TaxID=3404131 RepID=UPI003F841C65
MSATDLRTRPSSPDATPGRGDRDRSPRSSSAKRPGPGRWIGRVLGWSVIGVFLLFFVIPIVWLLLAPTKTARQLLLDGPFTFGAFDTLATNWGELMAFQDGIVWVWLGNATLYTGVALIITLVVSIPAGYALAMVEFRFRRALLVTTLIVMLIPNTALVLPIFLELSSLKLVGTPLSVILPFSFFPFGVYLTYIYFSTAVSRDLLNAARIDGAGEFRVFAQVAMPLATPVIALVGFFSLVGNWNNYFLPFVMVPGRKSPIQVGLAELLSNVPLFNPTTAGSVTISLPVLALATLLSVAPVLIIFLFSQRFLVSGLTAGGTKE